MKLDTKRKKNLFLLAFLPVCNNHEFFINVKT